MKEFVGFLVVFFGCLFPFVFTVVHQYDMVTIYMNSECQGETYLYSYTYFFTLM